MMKILKYNWSRLNDVGVIYNGRKQTRWEKGQLSYEVRGNVLRQKEDTQGSPYANGWLNNWQIALRGVVMKEKKKLKGIKGMDERNKFRQLTHLQHIIFEI